MTTNVIHPRMFDRLGLFYPARVTIQVASESADSTGQMIPAWANIPGCTALAARISPTGGQEKRLPEQIIGIATHMIELTAAHREIIIKNRAIDDRGKTFDIVSVETDGNSKTTRLGVRELV